MQTILGIMYCSRNWVQCVERKLNYDSIIGIWRDIVDSMIQIIHGLNTVLNWLFLIYTLGIKNDPIGSSLMPHICGTSIEMNK